MRLPLVCVLALAAAACAPRRRPETAPLPASTGVTSELRSAADIEDAMEARVADLKSRGGVCEEFGVVLEQALASGRVTIRPFMWRVEGNLASAMAESSGEITIARDIDSLNVGVRRLEDVLRSAEHEAAHIALRIPSGDHSREALVDERVASCRGGFGPD